jgi:hypothetical protein
MSASFSIAAVGKCQNCVVIDEGVKMKGTDTQVGKGIRQMQPR